MQLEKILNPTPLAETVPAKPEPAERRGESGGAKETSQQESALTGDQTVGFWSRINTFLRRVAWICFIILSLAIGGILPSLSWSIWTIIGTIGVAGVGLIFLRSKKRQPFLEILGGTVLGGIAFTNLALSRYNYHYSNNDFEIFIFPALFSLWLFVGTRFFLRSANTTGRLLWGMLLIIGGISLLLLPTLLRLLSALMCEACGVMAIIVALRKRKHDKHAIPSKEVIH